MKVLITGATGFVGRYVVNRFLEGEAEVHLIVRNPGKAKRLFGDCVSIHKVDLADEELLCSKMEEIKADVLVHLIGILFEERKKGITFDKVHYLYSAYLYNCALKTGVKRVLHMSALGTHDKAPSQYHRTKRQAEKYLMECGLDYTIFRPSLILGPEQKLFTDMKKITKILPIIALPDGGGYRFQPVDVRDVAECFFIATQKDTAHRKIYELCGSEKVSFKKLLEDVFSFWKKRVFMIPVPLKFMYWTGKVLEKLLDPPPFSSDQMLMMWRENLCGLSEDAIPYGVKELLGRDPIPYEKSLRWSLERFRSSNKSML